MYVRKNEAALMCPFGENKVCLKEKCAMWWGECGNSENRGYCGLATPYYEPLTQAMAEILLETKRLRRAVELMK